MVTCPIFYKGGIPRIPCMINQICLDFILKKSYFLIQFFVLLFSYKVYCITLVSWFPDGVMCLCEQHCSLSLSYY